MSAKRFWSVYLGAYCAIEAVYVLAGAGVLPDFLLRVLAWTALPILFFGLAMEGWCSTQPSESDKKWIDKLGPAGIAYPFPLVFAILGRISPWFLALSAILFGCLVLRLVRLRLVCLRSPDSAGDGNL